MGVPRKQVKFWLPAYEWYNQDIVNWSKAMGLTLINYSPGTRSNADYLEDTAKNFVSSKAILDSIIKKRTIRSQWFERLPCSSTPRRRTRMHGQIR